MNLKNVEEKVLERKPEIIILITGLVLLGTGIFWWKTGQEQKTKVEILGTGIEVKNASSGAALVVDISGAVISPGVYSFTEGARVDEVITKAGGLGDGADQNWIEMYLNRSAKVVDGQKIYIPYVAKPTLNKVPEGNRESVVVVNHKININFATKGELDTLYGVGPVTADKIITNRPYSRLEELREKKIVSQKVYDQIKDKISLW